MKQFLRKRDFQLDFKHFFYESALKLKHLGLLVLEVLEQTNQLPLVSWGLLGATDGGHESRGATHEHLCGGALLRGGEEGRDHVLVHVPHSTLPAVTGLAKGVQDLGGELTV